MLAGGTNRSPWAGGPGRAGARHGTHAPTPAVAALPSLDGPLQKELARTSPNLKTYVLYLPAMRRIFGELIARLPASPPAAVGAGRHRAVRQGSPRFLRLPPDMGTSLIPCPTGGPTMGGSAAPGAPWRAAFSQVMAHTWQMSALRGPADTRLDASSRAHLQMQVVLSQIRNNR